MGHSLAKSETADVIVIGGGIVGCSTAYYLSKRGFDVQLLEARDLASGATGHNIGYVWIQTRKPGPELELSMFTHNMLPHLQEELDYDFELRQTGGMIYYETEDQAQIMKEFADKRNEDGITIKLLDKKEALEMAPVLPDKVIGSTFCPMDSLVHPGLYTQAFAFAARRNHTRIRTGVSVESLITEKNRVVGVKTSDGVIKAKYVVVCTGAWTPELTAKHGLNIPIFGMRLQIISTAALEDRILDRALYGPVSAKQYKYFQELPSYKDEAFREDYEWRYEMIILHGANQMKSGHFLFGMPMDYPGLVTEPSLQGIGMMSEAMHQDFPSLRTATFERAWASVLPFTTDSLPIIDFVPQYEGLLLNAGHAFGNAAGPASGMMAAEMIAGEKTTLDRSAYSLSRPELATFMQGIDSELKIQH